MVVDDKFAGRITQLCVGLEEAVLVGIYRGAACIAYTVCQHEYVGTCGELCTETKLILQSCVKPRVNQDVNPGPQG